MRDIFIIPQKKISIIAEINNNEITELHAIDIPFDSKSVVLDNGYIVSLCLGINILKIFDNAGNLIKELKIGDYSTINSKDNILYLGGQYSSGIGDREFSGSGEMFSIIDLNNISYNIVNIQLPIKGVKGKAIDDILIQDNELILVDNIIYPKYLFKYDITVPSEPKFLSQKQLPNSGTYEHIKKGDINNNWMVLFSSSVGRGGSSQCITISGKSSYSLSTYFPFEFDEHDELVYNDESDKFIDICLKGNILFILRNNGLFSHRLDNKSDKKLDNEDEQIKTEVKDGLRLIKTMTLFLLVMIVMN
tara:strand:+ start:1674 stop:2588 length:915 start_codon:yes stop_codon:yes gene_type:complete